MRELFVGLIFCALTFVATAQKEDAVLSLLAQADRVALQRLDSALIYFDSALNIAQSINNQSLIFKCYRNKAFILEDNTRIKEAIEAYREAKNIAEQYLDNKSKLAIYNDWAIIHKKIKEFKVTREYHQKAIRLAEKTGDWENVEAGYHGLGTMYSMLSNFSQAVYQYRKSIEAAEKYHNQEGVLLSLQNISNVFFKAKDFEHATENLNKTYTLAIQLKDSVRLATALKLYGSIASERKNYAEALVYYQKAKAIYLKKQKKDRLAEVELLIAELWANQGNIKNAHLAFDTCFSYQQFFQPYTAADYYNKLAKLLLKEHKTQEAIMALEKGLTLADSVQFKEIAFDNLQQLVQIYQQLGKFEKANLYLQKAFQLQKILENDNNLLKFKHLELEYDLELQAKEIEQQQAALQQSTIIHWIMGIATFLLAALLFFTWRQLNEKKKAVAYSKVLLKELHHRVKNNLQNIVSIVRLQSRSIQDAEAKLVIKDSQERLEAIAILHQQFYQNEDINQVDFSRFLENLMKNKLFLQNLDGKEIKYLISTDNNSVSIENSLPIALIINELVTNSIKHAFKENDVIQPQINITIKDKTMVYTDNGVSRSAAINEKTTKSFGTQLISDLCLQLDGNYQTDTNEGFRFELKF